MNTKKSEAQKRAENKFKMVGAKFNEEQQEEILNRLTDLGINQSQYIKKLVRADLSTKKSLDEDLYSENDLRANNANFEALEAMSERVKELEKENEELTNKYEVIINSTKNNFAKLETSNKNLIERINHFDNLSLLEKIKFILRGKGV